MRERTSLTVISAMTTSSGLRASCHAARTLRRRCAGRSGPAWWHAARYGGCWCRWPWPGRHARVIYLHAENEEFQPIVVNLEEQPHFEIEGIAVGIIRNNAWM